MSLSCHHIAGAANTAPSSVLWLDNVLPLRAALVIAIHNVIAVADFEAKKILYSLRGHDGKITALAHIKRDCAEPSAVEFVSASEDGRVIMWKHSIDMHAKSWTKTAELNDLCGSIDCLSALSSPVGILLTASNSKGQLMTWFRRQHASADSAMTMLHSVDLPPSQMAKSLSLMHSPFRGSSATGFEVRPVILAVGGVDSRCHLRMFAPCVEEIEGVLSRSYLPSISVGVLTGHDDWVTCITEGLLDNGDLHFATGSQDSKIRLWKVSVCADPSQLDINSSTLHEVEVEDDDDEAEGAEEGGGEVPAPNVTVSEEATGEARCAFVGTVISADGAGKSSSFLYAVSLEALLVGHEDWVSSVHWMLKSPTGTQSPGSTVSRMRLFSTSMDRNMVIWEPDSQDGIWAPLTRIGDIGGNLGGSVGGNLLGFVGGCVGRYEASTDASVQCIVGIGYGGSFHLWESVETATESVGARWRPEPFLTGHFGPVMDLVWGGTETGTGNATEYILTASLDQTCRMFVPLPLSGEGGSASSTWCEISRPQIHGYELTCIQLTPPSHKLYHMYTGGEEKAIRTFEAPLVVLEGLSKLAGNYQARELLDRLRSTESSTALPSRVASAYIPELGLSNRAASLMTDTEAKEQAARGVDTLKWDKCPLEGQLSDKTIWPELHKLHGHKGDVVCMAASHCGKWLASCGKGRDASSSAIFLWETERMICVATLVCHQSTVAALSFSPDSRYIASGGKDRSVWIHEVNSTGQGDPYVPVACIKSAHKRIIWDITWVGNCSNIIATGARDGFVKVWKISDVHRPLESLSDSVVQCQVDCVGNFSPFNGRAVTALDSTKSYRLCPEHSSADEAGWCIAAGGECGSMELWSIRPESCPDDVCRKLLAVESCFCHGAAVRRIKWNDDTVLINKDATVSTVFLGDGSENSQLKFASGGDDNCVRIFSI